MLALLARLRWYERMALVLGLGLAVRVNLPRLVWRGLIDPAWPVLFPLLLIGALALLCYALAWHYDERLA